MTASTYHRLVHLLAEHDVTYRLIEHPPEGQTAAASRLRRHPLEQAAKCLIVRVRTSKRGRRYVLAVVPGDRTADLERVGTMLGGDQAALATRDVAERLTGCAIGSIIPFSFHPELELVVDGGLFEHDEMFFNAARLDLSIGIRTADYRRLVHPRIAHITRQPPELAA